MFPQLGPVLGMVGEGPTRWRGLLESRCRTGEELRMLWATLQEEAGQMSVYLGVGMEGPLTVPVEGAGGVNCDGSSRRIITTYLESTRAAVLKTGLERHHDHSVTAWALRAQPGRV